MELSKKELLEVMELFMETKERFDALEIQPNRSGITARFYDRDEDDRLVGQAFFFDPNIDMTKHNTEAITYFTDFEEYKKKLEEMIGRE